MVKFKFRRFSAKLGNAQKFAARWRKQGLKVKVVPVLKAKGGGYKIYSSVDPNLVSR